MRLKLNYIIIPLITLCTMIAGGWLTIQGMNWYHTLKLPNYTPSGKTISWIWRIIFTLTTLFALIVWNNFGNSKHFNVIIALLICNACLNTFWSYLFFYQRIIGAAIVDAVLITLTVGALIYLVWAQSPIIALLLLPYLIWSIFATYLNSVIWLMNK